MSNAELTWKAFRRCMCFWGLVAVFVAMLSVTVYAQQQGQIAGTVTDATGAAIPNVAITARDMGTNVVHKATTNGTGEYVLPGLAPATYEVTIAATGGFGGFTTKAEVTVGGRLTVNVQLQASSNVETVDVQGEKGVAVNTQTQEVSQVVNEQQVANLPSLTRNPYDFVAISGNISEGDKVTSSGATSTTGDQNDTTRGVGFSFSDNTYSLNAPTGAGIPRYLLSAPISQSRLNKIQSQAGSNVYNLGFLPAAALYPASSLPLGGISDFGTYPHGMTARNAFYGAGAWNVDVAVSNRIPITERVYAEFRAEGFNILNHHNMYLLETENNVANYGYGVALPIQGRKGGVNGGANDERRFGQFAARVMF